MINFFKKNKLIILIIILGTFLRLYRIPAYTEFLGDQGRDVLRIRQLIKKGDLIFIGPQTSIGNMYLGPWYYYLIAPSLLLANFSPLGPAIFNALIGLLAIWLIYKFGSQWFGKKFGLWSGAFLAASPVVIKYSTFIWNPNVMPFFSLMSIWFLWRVWIKDDYQSLVWLSISLAMVLNSHYLGLLLFPVAGLVILLKFFNLFTNKDNQQLAVFLKIGALSLGIFCILMSPLLIFDIKHGFPNFNAFLTFFTQRQTTFNLNLSKLILNINQVFDQLVAQFLTFKDSGPWSWLILPLVFWGVWKERDNKTTWLLFICLIIGLLGMAAYKQDIYGHYYLFLYPALGLLISLGITKLKVFGFIPGLLIIGLMIFNWHGWSPPVYQLQRAKKVSRFIEKKSNNQKFALGLIAEQNYDDPYRYFLTIKKENNLVDLHNQMTEQLFVICEPWGNVNCNPIGHDKWQIAAFGWAQIDDKWQLEGIELYRLVHRD